MDKIQINKSRMYGAVDMVLDNHSTNFSEFSGLVQAHQQLKRGQEQIGHYRQIQEANITGLTKTKVILRNEMVSSILRFSTALRAYANSVKNEELKSKAKYGLSGLKKSADSILVDIGTLILGLAKPLQGELASFIIGENEFNDLERLIASFKLAIPQHRAAASVLKNSTMNISEVFTAQDRLLKEDIDVLMLLIRNSQPDFYEAYKNARNIVDYVGRRKVKTEMPLAG